MLGKMRMLWMRFGRILITMLEYSEATAAAMLGILCWVFDESSAFALVGPTPWEALTSSAIMAIGKII